MIDVQNLQPLEIRVLVIDDDPNWRELLVDILKYNKVNANIAVDGLDGIEKIEQIIGDIRSIKESKIS